MPHWPGQSLLNGEKRPLSYTDKFASVLVRFFLQPVSDVKAGVMSYFPPVQKWGMPGEDKKHRGRRGGKLVSPYYGLQDP